MVEALYAMNRVRHLSRAPALHEAIDRFTHSTCAASYAAKEHYSSSMEWRQASIRSRLKTADVSSCMLVCCRRTYLFQRALHRLWAWQP